MQSELFAREAVDFGGTRVRAAQFDADLNLLCRVEMPTLAQQALDPAFFHDDLIQMTQLGDDVCLIGAAAYARSQFFAPIGVE